MEPNSMVQPVGALMRGVPRLPSDASLEMAAALLRDGAPMALVADGATILGVLTNRSLASAMGAGAAASDSVQLALDRDVPRIPLHASGAEALRGFSDTGTAAYLVCDPAGRPVGTLVAADLWRRSDERPRPDRVGGMATPFGVYLTTGTLSAGTGGLALVATGALMFVLLAIAQFAGLWVAQWIQPFSGHAVANGVYNALPIALFLVGMRLIPLSGIHAAEHKVVHAIERGESLTAAAVRRMPRVHPRCGTNIAVAATLFMGFAGTHEWFSEYAPLVALLITLALWKPLGSLAQYWVTTKEPNDKQLALGIRAGEELLARYAKVGHAHVPIHWRIWNTGMIHVMAGAFLVYGLLALTSVLFGFELVL